MPLAGQDVGDSSAGRRQHTRDFISVTVILLAKRQAFISVTVILLAKTQAFAAVDCRRRKPSARNLARPFRRRRPLDRWVGLVCDSADSDSPPILEVRGCVARIADAAHDFDHVITLGLSYGKIHQAADGSVFGWLVHRSPNGIYYENVNVCHVQKF